MIPVGEGVGGLVFDFDGTLADTMPHHYRAWGDVLRARGGHFPEPLFYSLGGKATVDIVGILNKEMGYDLDPAEIAAAKEERFLEYIDQVRPIEEVARVVRHFHGRLPMGIGSGNLRWLVERTLSAIGMVGIFDVIVTADDVRQGKPEPETFLRVAEGLNVPPAACQVFEDGELGLEAARRAGMLATDIRLYVEDAK